jgi:hypothetical protein
MVEHDLFRKPVPTFRDHAHEDRTMPPVIVWAIGAIGAAVAGRWLFKEARRVNAELHPDERAPVNEVEMGNLERDPKTGVYRPK